MKTFLVLLCAMMVGMVTAAAQDSDRDGLPDKLDRQPHTAEYYQGTAMEPTAPGDRSKDVDSDGDGRPDFRDKAPHTAWYYNAWVAPPPPPDTDGDGVIDDLDKCPETPSGVQVDADGCPVDSDGDGVADYLDKCPGTAEGVKVDPSGCALDTDGDGVADHADKCPDTPKGATVDASGCTLDTDGDGVADYLDKCSGTPAGIPVDETGCPKMTRKGEKIVLDIKFATNSAEIQEESFEILEGVAKTMIDFPDINIAIRGFTDNSGSEAHNLDLSNRRANAVKGFLQDEGVAGNRMTAQGFGEDPQYFVADNDSAEGRAKNRRVEIESVE